MKLNISRFSLVFISVFNLKIGVCLTMLMLQTLYNIAKTISQESQIQSERYKIKAE